MIGFDSAALQKEFNISDNEVPVMMVTVGTVGPDNWPQKPRRHVSDVLSII